MKMSRAAAIDSLAGLLFIVFLLSTICEAVTSISCTTVIEEVSQCAGFLLKNSNQPPEACCNGVKKLSGDIGSQKDRTAVCQCLKDGLAMVGNYDPTLIPEIPKDCGLSITLPPIDQKTDCANIIFIM